jgi:D-glucosaminate-6-phosphate ammonia-lyase
MPSDFLESLGIRPIINACGTVTRLGAARLPEPVVAAMTQAAGCSMRPDQLQGIASHRISAVTGTEAGLVTAGASAALTLGAAAILAGSDLARMERLPDTRGMRRTFLVAADQRSGYDHAVRAAGARLRTVGVNEAVSGAGVRRAELWEYQAAIDRHTAGILYVQSDRSEPPLAAVVELAHRYELPVLVDAAAEVPPLENLWRLPASGADLVAFSGGKGLRGPQASGILCGRRELIRSAALQMLDMDELHALWEPVPGLLDGAPELPGLPRQGIGRGLKVSKEQIVGLLAALELALDPERLDPEPQQQRWLERISSRLEGLGCRCELAPPTAVGRRPRLWLHLRSEEHEAAPLELCRQLQAGDPAIYVVLDRLSDGIIGIDPIGLSEQEIDLLSHRMAEVFTANLRRTSRPAAE